MVSIPATVATFTLAAVLALAVAVIALAALAVVIAVHVMAGAPLPRITFYRSPVSGSGCRRSANAVIHSPSAGGLKRGRLSSDKNPIRVSRLREIAAGFSSHVSQTWRTGCGILAALFP
jgi:hypothetical protein